MSNGCEIMKCKYWDGEKCDSPHETCIYQTSDETEALQQQISTLQEKLSKFKDLAEYARHDEGCNAPFGYSCKCGFDRAKAEIDLPTGEQESK